MSTISRVVQPVAYSFAACMGALWRALHKVALLGLAVLAIGCAGNVHAADESTSAERKARLAIPPEFRHLDFVLAAAEGDLNGDGVPDRAMLLMGRKGEGPQEERLFVLTGKADGGYQVLSVSGEFCHPSKFYNLDIKNNSLFVQAVFYADAARFSGFTLQFRYNPKTKDLEHIGEQQDDEDYPSNSYHRVSLN